MLKFKEKIMIYNNGFPANTTYQTVPQAQANVPTVGYTQPTINQYSANQQSQIQNQPIFNQIRDSRIMINGIENARLYPIAPNIIETLWDIDGETFYIVSAGTEPKVYTYKEKYIATQTVDESTPITEKIKEDNYNDYVTLNDLDGKLNELSANIDNKINDLLTNIEDKINNISIKDTDYNTDNSSTPPQAKSRTMGKTNKGGK